MTSDPTAEQGEIRRKGRQRLIGAVTLALLAAVFIPMLLDSEPRERRAEPSLAIPARDSAPPLAAAPVPAMPAKDAVPASAPAQAEVPAAAAAQLPSPAPPAAEPRKSVEPKAAEFKSAPDRAPSPAQGEQKSAVAASAPKLEGFVVQVGAFKDDAKLAQARDKLSAAKVSHYTERLATSSGELTRLRAGPFATRQAAEKAAADMKRAGIDGRVVSLP